MPRPQRQDDSPISILRAVLTPAEVRRLHEVSKALEEQQAPLGYDVTLRPAEDLPFGLRPPHESLFLHRDGFIARACPDIFDKLIRAARSHLASEKPLGVRTVEYHTYRVGGALLDPEHCDMGSVTTMSCLLSDPTAFVGGVFTTFQCGKAVLHNDLKCGDAICFESERVHNVSAVTSGSRHSLVVELWESGDNNHDRHS